MGVYVNPGNQDFDRINGPDYIDKTGLIALMNTRISKSNNLVCISRPRRFGKSYAAKMLSAYYDCSCKSDILFDDKIIANTKDYHEYMNKYNVIYLDISGFVSNAKIKEQPLKDIPKIIIDTLTKEMQMISSEFTDGSNFNDALVRYVNSSEGNKFVFIIDEWDAMIRETKNDFDAQEAYLNLLRSWFKNNNFTTPVVAAAYMTGILPIKKDGSQSAISDFDEYSVMEPMEFAEYFGFTEDEVKTLCSDNNISFDTVKKWYDGYILGSKRSMYNPFSVMSAVKTKKIRSFWKKTSAAEALMTYIDMDQKGLQDDIARLIAGESIEVDTDSFQNDVETFTCKDDVLTLLIHLGYLTYEELSNSYDDRVMVGLAKIPNEEVRLEFEKLLRKSEHKELIALVQRSDQLLNDTLAGNELSVAKAIQEVHDSVYSPTFYNNEQSLRSVIRMAYISCVDQYAKIEELPSGHGNADVVFIPKIRSTLPALVIELKWNQNAEGAISQILDKNYSAIPVEFSGEVILVGISYDEKTKQHLCSIKKIIK